MFRQQMVILFISVLQVEHRKTETVIDGGRGVQVRKSPTRNLPSQRGINAGFVFWSGTEYYTMEASISIFIVWSMI